MASKTQWCSRTLTVCSRCFCLCLTEKEFHKELRKLKVPLCDWPRFTLSDATVHHIRTEFGPVSIVCIDKNEAVKRDPISIVGLLSHEAVHIWQQYTRDIGSFNDHGDEEEAYAIQSIVQELLWAYRDKVYGK